MIVGMGSAGGVLEGDKLLQTWAGVWQGRLLWVRLALILLSQKSQGLPPLQTVTAKSMSSDFELGRGHPGHPTLWSWKHMVLPQGKLLASNFAWEGAPAWLGHLQNKLAGEVGGAGLRPPTSLGFLTMYV